MAPISDNLISVRELSATEAARNFSDMLDAVEHEGESFLIRRRGRVVARMEPAPRSPNGAAVRALLQERAKHPDPEFADHVEEAMRTMWPDLG